MTIGRLAASAGVGVETVRYYQRRRLLPIPATMGVRRYTADVLERVRFIKRSQALGFSLEEVRELLRLEEGGTRAQVRRIAGARLAGVRAKLAALHAMEHVLSRLLDECEAAAPNTQCPIIAALATGDDAVARA
ncbi:MAG: MerR family transcriptional regulator [Proteobacteria bacterium]|nr:MerR family transcriptional regulator [Pseudomonadota bacterium]